MTHESLEEKAGRLLVEGRVRLNEIHDGQIRATIRGDHGLYSIRYDSPSRRLRCSCPSWRSRCSHVRAVALVAGEGP